MRRVNRERAAFAVDVRAAVWSDAKKFKEYTKVLDP